MRMSKVRNPMFRMVNASTQSSGSFHQALLGAAMLFPQFRCHGVEFDRLLQHRVVAVPLDEIGAAHERAVFAGAAVVVPEIEVNKIYGLREWRASQDAIF